VAERAFFCEELMMIVFRTKERVERKERDVIVFVVLGHEARVGHIAVAVYSCRVNTFAGSLETITLCTENRGEADGFEFFQKERSELLNLFVE